MYLSLHSFIGCLAKSSLAVTISPNIIMRYKKRAGIIVHPGAGNYQDTLVNGLLYHCKESLSGIGGVMRPGIVHRIDKMTSGLLVIAKNDMTHNQLSEQFKNRKINRKYICLTWNSTNLKKGLIRTNIYNMNVKIDYNNIENNIKKLKQNLNI